MNLVQIPMCAQVLAAVAEDAPPKKKKKKKKKKMSKEDMIKAAAAAQAAAKAALEQGLTHEDAAKAADALLKVGVCMQTFCMHHRRIAKACTLQVYHPPMHGFVSMFGPGSVRLCTV
jgi:hypothetical protein